MRDANEDQIANELEAELDKELNPEPGWLKRNENIFEWIAMAFLIGVFAYGVSQIQ